MVVDITVVVILGMCFCMAMITTVFLGLIVRDYFKVLIKNNEDLKFENKLLISEIDKTIEELEEVQKNLDYKNNANKEYVTRLYGTKNKNVACSAGTEQTTVI